MSSAMTILPVMRFPGCRIQQARLYGVPRPKPLAGTALPVPRGQDAVAYFADAPRDFDASPLR
jgi:hypothetical protein